MHNPMRAFPIGRLSALAFLMAASVVTAAAASAQTPPPPSPVVERMTLDEAVRRAIERNPTVTQAIEAILRAEGLLQQARAATRPSLTGTFSSSTLDSGVQFDDTVVQPRTQATLGADFSLPILAPARWAATNQARDQIQVANLSVADVRRQIAIATAQTFLGVIGDRRLVEVNQRALEAARAHLDYAQRRLAAGAGTRLNELRAAQEVSSDEARVETASLAVRRAQEALGVLTASPGPVEAAAEPTFDIPPASATADEAAWMGARTDIQLSTAIGRALERVWLDSKKDKYPTATVSFSPQAVAPSGAFAPSRSWRLTIGVTQPLFDSGLRKGLATVREAETRRAAAALTSVQIQARSEVRVARDTVESAERAQASLRQAASQAGEVLTITTTAFEAGATTNIEVIDAQRSARDAESAVAIAEDSVRRARLDLLTALGQFPR